jgi:hypothetical protein
VRTDLPFRRASAADALGEFGPAAEPAVPALIQVLRDDLASKESSNFYEGAAAARAIGRIAPGTRLDKDAFAMLARILESRSETHSTARLATIEALPAFGTEAIRTLPRLRELRQDPNLRQSAAAGKAVTAIEAAGPEYRDEKRSQ